MNIIGIQLILFSFSIFMSYVVFLHWKRKEITFATFGSWLTIWMSLIFLVFFPKILEPLIFNFFVRMMDFGMVVAFIILAFLTLENNIKIKSYEKLLEKMVRQMAIKRKKRKKVK